MAQDNRIERIAASTCRNREFTFEFG